MTEDTIDTPTQDVPAAPSSEDSATATPTKKPIVASIALLLSCVAIAATAGLFYYTQFMQPPHNAETAAPLTPTQAAVTLEAFEALKTQLASQEEHLTQWQNQQAQSQSQGSEQLDTLVQAQQQNTEELARLGLQLGTLQGRWQSAFTATHLERKIDRLEQLLSDAQRQLYLTQSAEQTRLLLETALQECQQAQSGLLQNVCAEIQQDVQRIAIANLPDHMAILEQLNQISLWIEQGLLQQRVATASFQPESTKPGSTDESGLNTAPKWQSAWQALKTFITHSLVRVHQHTQPGLYDLTLEQAQLLRQNLLMTVQQIRSSVVQKDTALYQNGIQALKAQIALYQNDFTAYLNELNTALEQLEQESIRVDKQTGLKASHLLKQIQASLAEEAAL